jgi:hypothetical protein
MTDRRAVSLFLLGPWFNPSFWDDVEYEIDTVDVDDFVDFVAAGDVPVEPRPEFEADLRERLRAFVAARYPGRDS